MERFTVKAIQNMLSSKQINAAELFDLYSSRITDYDQSFNAFITSDVEPNVEYITDDKNQESLSDAALTGIPYAAKDKMNETTAPFNPNESEIDIAKLQVLESKLISPSRLAISPIHMECKLYKIIDLPTLENNEYNGMVLGHVVGIHIKDEVLDGGKVNLEKIKPLSRLGYLDYSVVDNIFEMLRPEGSPRPDK